MTETEEEKKARKRAKKEAKKARKEKESGEEAVVVVAPSEIVETSEKSKKKDKKRKERDETEEESKKSTTTTTTTSSSKKVKVSSKHLSASETEAWREKHEVKIEGEGIDEYFPITSFELAKDYFDAETLKVTENFTTPSPIQAQCWHPMICGRDVIGVAETGSGKTLAFLLPAIAQFRKLKTVVKPQAPAMLVVAPTRELAMQSAKVAEEVGKITNLKSICIYGGVPKFEQKKDLRQCIHILVATPGRLLDQIEDGAVNLSSVSYVVLDEADRMLDQGFEKDIRRILAMLPTKRQTLLFTATWPESIRKIAAEFITNPVRITIGSVDLTANVRVQQIVEVIEDRARDARVCELLKDYHSTRKNLVLIFVLYKKEASRVEQMLQRKGYSCGAIHGDLSQDIRTKNFEAFKSGKTPLLIATDVAARGLDIPNVSHVINYSFPLTIEDYIHRIGRTGRAGKSGISHTFFQDSDKPRAGELQNILREAGVEVPAALLKFGSTVKRKNDGLLGAWSRPKGVSADEPLKAAVKITFDSDDE